MPAAPAAFKWDSTLYCAAGGQRHGAVLHARRTGRLLASTGMSSDGQVCVWDWHSGSLLGKQHTRALGVTACFTEDGSCVVTAGKEHFKVSSCASTGWSAPGQYE